MENKAEVNKNQCFPTVINHLGKIFNEYPFPVAIKNADGFIYVYTNKHFEQLLNKGSHKEFIGKTDFDFFNCEQAEFLLAKQNELLEKRENIVINDEIFKLNNSDTLPYKIKFLLLADESTHSEYIILLFEPIVNFHHCNEDIQKNIVLLSNLFRFSPIATIIIRTTDHTIVNINHAALKLIDIELNEAINKKLEDLDEIIENDTLNNFIDTLKSYNTLKDYQISINTKKGKILNWAISVEHIEIEEESFWILTAIDISQRIDSQKKIMQSLDKEKDLNMLKSRFISMISHEFRTPLTTIMLSTDLLKNYGSKWDDSEKEKHYLRIKGTVLNMTQLMEKVLTVGQMDSGKFVFKPESMDLQSYIKSLVDSVEFSFAGSHKVIFNMTGECTNPYADESLLGLILNNLLTNAAKYSPNGSEIIFNAEINEDYLKFFVQDFGIGIPEKDMQHIFKTFFRAGNSGFASGYGLGLSIVKRCVDTHLGTIQIESKENFGTKFTVTLPISQKAFEQ